MKGSKMEGQQEEKPRPRQSLLATYLLLGTLLNDGIERSNDIPRGYRCGVCRQEGYHAADCAPPRGLERVK